MSTRVRPRTPFLLGLAFILSLQLIMAQKRFDKDSQSRGLLWGWGHSWKHGWPGYGKTQSDLAFIAFHPQMGWFVSDHFELYGEATLLLYHQPRWDISTGLLGFAGRYHFVNHRKVIPYVTMGAGLLWTSLEVVEIDRVFNFQVVCGGGLRFVREKGPGLIFEFRNHHISNAGTAGENLGTNVAAILVGVDWVLR